MDSRRDFYYFLSWLYLEGPPEELVRDLMNGKFQLEYGNREIEEGVKILKEWAASVKDMKEGYLDAQDEFARLFIGPGKPIVSPYQSVYEEGAPYGKATLRMKEIYAEAEVSKGGDVKEAEDHIGMELAFMGLICNRISSLGDKGEILRNLHIQKKFLNEQLLKWVPRFCEDILKSERAFLYRGVAMLTLGFLEEEKRSIEQLIADYELE
ncbi:TorD/DmsD family molecular chaperone [Candidatus Pyrohabitans sp.]